MADALDSPDIATQLARRRRAAADAWQLHDDVVLIGAGEPIQIPGRADITYPFQAHSEYLYLTDRRLPGGVLAFDPGEGWIDFPPPVTEADRLWSGVADDDHAPRTTADLGGWLARGGRDRHTVWLGSPPTGREAIAERDPDGAADPARAALTERLRLALSAVRRPKDAVELERMRSAERATRAAFARVIEVLADGVTERDAQIELEAEAFRHGAAAMGYDTIIGTGPNSAVLHFMPSGRAMHRGELVLIDAGAEHLGYVSDITRTFCVGGSFDDSQRELHAVVHAAQRGAIDAIRPGVEWRDVHLLAARTIADGLVAVGILRGSADSLVESGAAGLFFPHGIGHLVGLGVRDAGEPLYERRNDPPPFANLRIDLPLEVGMVVTVEPGVYFVPALLQDPERRRRHRDEVDWSRVDRMLGFGGIRIEDNLLVTADAHEVITADVPLL
ncbi:MAG TPA: aminopeptidase P family protein [Solirubrobacteraceae bacterium]|nr:aminopeptidase P family protein [Solirubrobacteraceae bacterium]